MTNRLPLSPILVKPPVSTDSEVIKVLKISRPGLRDPLVVRADLKTFLDTEELAIFLTEDEVGSCLNLELADMTEKEFRLLPEFEGW